MGFVITEINLRVQNHIVPHSAERGTSIFFNRLYYGRNTFASYFPKFLSRIKLRLS